MGLSRLGHADEGAIELLKLPAQSLASEQLMLGLSNVFRLLAQPPRLAKEYTGPIGKASHPEKTNVPQPMSGTSLRYISFPFVTARSLQLFLYCLKCTPYIISAYVATVYLVSAPSLHLSLPCLRYTPYGHRFSLCRASHDDIRRFRAFAASLSLLFEVHTLSTSSLENTASPLT